MNLATIPILAKVIEAENYLKSLPDEMVIDGKLIKTKRELKVEHHFSFGVYARILYIPADTFLTGKLHKYPQINLLREGDISVLVGDKVKRLKAPFVVASPAGIKRIAYTHKDTIWITVHKTNLTNLEQIEQTFIVQDEKRYLDDILSRHTRRIS